MKIAIDRQIDTKVPGLAIAAVDADGVLWSEGFGHANLATGLGMTPGTVCNWPSMTKLVTATAVMQLADEGLLGLDAPVASYYEPLTTGVWMGFTPQRFARSARLPEPR